MQFKEETEICNLHWTTFHCECGLYPNHASELQDGMFKVTKQYNYLQRDVFQEMFSVTGPLLLTESLNDLYFERHFESCYSDISTMKITLLTSSQSTRFGVSQSVKSISKKMIMCKALIISDQCYFLKTEMTTLMKGRET